MPRTKVTYREPVTWDLVRRVLRYEPESGRFFWNKDNFNHRKPGDEAGSHNDQGYRVIVINRRTFPAHRLAWLYMTGRWPEDEIDHINGIRDDNRFCNLREATRVQNILNTRVGKNNKLGVKGVRLVRGRYQARIAHNKINICIGTFDTLDEAERAYAEHAKRLKGVFCVL